MGLFSFFSSRTSEQKALTASGTVLQALQSRQFSAFPTLGGTTIDYQRMNAAYVEVQNGSYGWLYNYCPAVRRVLGYIAGNMAQLDVKLYERIDDDHREHVGDHPAARSIRHPNPTTPGRHFIFALAVDFLVYDNAYALKVPQPDGTVQLYNIPAGRVGILGKNLFAADGYRIWSPYGGEPFDVTPEQMLHWRGHNPDKPRQGESKLETARSEIASDEAALTAVTEMHRSGLSLKAWLQRPLDSAPLSSEGRERLSEAVTTWAKKAGHQIPVFDEGMTYHTGGVTPEDAQFLDSRNFVFEAIASLYGLKNIPPANEEERRQFYSDVLPPFCDLCTSFLDLHILQAVYGRDDLYFEFSNEKIMDETVKTLVSATGRPVLTTNEGRAKLDQPPIDGGDELVTPMNVIVGDNPKPSPMIMPPQNPNGPPQDGSHRTEDVPQQASLNGNGHKKVPIKPSLHRAYERRNDWAKKYTSTLRRNFERQERGAKSSGWELKAIPEKQTEEMAQDFLGLYLQHAALEGDLQGFRLNSSFDIDLLRNWLKSKAEGSAKAINRSTEEQITLNGPKEAFNQAKDVRAEAIGLGMATDVASFAVREATRQAPGERMVTVSGGDCEQCAPYQGTWPASELEAWPAYHQNCQCVCDPF